MATIPPNVTAEDAYRLGQLLLFGQFMYGIGLWELIICAVGTPVNAVVLYIAIWLSKKGSSGNGGKQQWFVASMTAADLLFCSIHSPMFYALYTLGQRFDSGSCSLFYIISHISVVASSLSLLLINVDKFLALHKPLHYPSLMTTRRVWATLVCFWLVSIAWASFLVFGPFLSISNNCGPIFKPEYRILYYIFAVIFFALPVCASVFIAVFVIGIARRSRTPNLLVRSAGTGNGLASKWLLELHMASSNVETNSQKQRQVHQERRKNVKAITFVVTTTLWSAVTLLPYRFALIGNWMGYGGVVWPSIFLALTTMNALGNPFITIATQRQYRKRLRRLWRWITCRQSLADNDMLAQQVAATIRMMCQQQEQLITAASRRARLRASIQSNGDKKPLSKSSVECVTSPDDSATVLSTVRDPE